MIWPFSRRKKKPFTSRAIACVKAAVPEDDPHPTVDLPADETPVLRDMKNGLLVAYFVDLGNWFQWVPYRALANDGIDADQLHEIGLSNLARLATKVRVETYGNVFAVFLDGTFEASLILVDNLWNDSFRQFVVGEYAVAIPARDILAFCDADSESGIEELHGVIQRLQQAGADHPISNRIHVRKDGSWQPL